MTDESATLNSPLTDPPADPTPPPEAPPPSSNEDQPAPTRSGTDELEAIRRELEETRSTLEGLERVQQAARTIMGHGDGWSDEYERASRVLMTDAGYAPEAIDQWVQEQKTMAMGTAPAASSGPDGPSGGDPREEYIRRLEARLEAVEQQTGDTRLRDMNRTLGDTLDTVMRTHDPVKGFLEKWKRVSGDEGHEDRVKQLQEDIRRTTLENIRRKVNAGAKFDPSWFDREVKAASEEEMARLRAVIGDPDRLMRAPETVTGEDQFRRERPVSDLKWEPGDGPAKAQDKIRRHASDVLHNALAKMSVPGDSRA